MNAWLEEPKVTAKATRVDITVNKEYVIQHTDIKVT